MTERDGATMDIDLARVDGEDLLSGLYDDGKRLVDFEQRNVVLCQPSLLQCKRQRKRRRDGEINGFSRRICVG